MYPRKRKKSWKGPRRIELIFSWFGTVVVSRTQSTAPIFSDRFSDSRCVTAPPAIKLATGSFSSCFRVYDLSDSAVRGCSHSRTVDYLEQYLLMSSLMPQPCHGHSWPDVGRCIVQVQEQDHHHIRRFSQLTTCEAFLRWQMTLDFTGPWRLSVYNTSKDQSLCNVSCCHRRT